MQDINMHLFHRCMMCIALCTCICMFPILTSIKRLQKKGFSYWRNFFVLVTCNLQTVANHFRLLLANDLRLLLVANGLRMLLVGNVTSTASIMHQIRDIKLKQKFPFHILGFPTQRFSIITLSKVHLTNNYEGYFQIK